MQNLILPLVWTYYISQHKWFLWWFFNCFYFCHAFKIAWIINQTNSASTFKFLVLIVLLCIKCLQLSRFKVKCYSYFISLEFCELIREKCDEFLIFILHVLFYTKILTYFSLYVLFSFNLKISLIFSVIYVFCNHKVLTFFYRF